MASIDAEVLEENIDRETYAGAGFTVYNAVSLGEAERVLDYKKLEEYSTIDKERIERYQTYREWYAGKHKAKLSDRQRDLFEESGIDFADNFCDIVVDSVVRRMQVKGFAFQPETEVADTAVNEILKANRMDVGFAKIMHGMVKLGDHFCILDFVEDSNSVTIGNVKPELMNPGYDDSGEKLEWCAKVWKEDKVSVFNPNGSEVERMNVYFPNRIEKYIRIHEGKKAWKPYMDIATDQLWPVPWVDETSGEPLGIPVFHFRNGAYDTDYGVSDIHKAIPQQAMLNKFLLDLDLILDTQGYPRRWATGVSDTENSSESREDSHGESKFDDEPGSMWVVESDTAKFGQFEPADVSGPLESISMLVQHMSGSNSVPLWLIMSAGRFPSGESMKFGDSGLSDKVDDKLPATGNTLEDLIRYALKLREIRGQGLPSITNLETVEIECLWKDTTPRNQKEQVEIGLGIVELGGSKRYALSRLGIENVEQVMLEREAEIEEMMEMQNRSIARGILTDGGEIG